MNRRPWYSGEVLDGPAKGSSVAHGRPELWLAGGLEGEDGRPIAAARYTWDDEAGGWRYSAPGPDERRGERDRRESLR